MNLTHNCDTILFWPDTVFSYYYIGLTEFSDVKSTFKILQNYPNPAAERTTVSLIVPEKDKVSIMITDILGRLIVNKEEVLERGKHSFRFAPGNGSLYFFTAVCQGQSSSIKILQTGSNQRDGISLEYIGNEGFLPQLKAMQAIKSFTFNPGDELLYICNADTQQSGMLDTSGENTTYTFQFATNIPCTRMPTVEYEGLVYNTIQIFIQCWLKENLNVGEMTNVTIEQSNNGSIEKYCYNNEPDSCTKYGGLYHWNEMMLFTTQKGVQGICPPSRHLPIDEEWKILEGAVDSQFDIGDTKWDPLGVRGYDAGTNLKTIVGWFRNGNGSHLFGFSGLPSGYYNNIKRDFEHLGEAGSAWVSEESISINA